MGQIVLYQLRSLTFFGSLVGLAGLLWVGLVLSSLVAGMWLTSEGGADLGEPGALFSRLE